ncbi:MAG TPA: sigma-70 family RNA polymerase sigma factor, partial [Chthoniobacterales bacterium]
RKEQLELALQQLPDAQRVPLVLYHFQDLTYEEIAVQLKVSLAKVKTDIHRGRATLKILLGKIDA